MRQTIWVVFALVLCTGFRLYSSKKPWSEVNNSRDSRTKIFVEYEHADTELEDDLPSTDVLHGETITVATAMDSIFDNINNIEASYIQLVDDQDPDYDDHKSNRTIKIKEGDASGTNLGQAQFTRKNGKITGCTITLGPDSYEDAKLFIGVTSHEIGHCLGLDHPHETTHSVMSYFRNDVYRIQNDDKMGIIFLYPIDRDKVREEATFGLSCATK